MVNLGHSTVGVKGSNLGVNIFFSRDTNCRERFIACVSKFDAGRRGTKALNDYRDKSWMEARTVVGRGRENRRQSLRQTHSLRDIP